MADPEKQSIASDEEKKPWWLEWVELLAKLTGAQDLIKNLPELQKESDKTKLTKAIKKINLEERSTQDSFFERLTDLLQGSDVDKGKKIEELVENATNKSGLGGLLKNSIEDPSNQDENLEKGKKNVEVVLEKAQLELKPLLDKAENSDDEIREIQEMLKAEKEKITPLSDDQQRELIDNVLEDLRVKKETKDTINKARGIKPKNANEALQSVADEIRVKKMQSIWEKIKNSVDDIEVELSEEENKTIFTFLIQLMDEGKMDEAYALQAQIDKSTGGTKLNESMAKQYEEERKARIKATRNDLLEMMEKDDKTEAMRTKRIIDILTGNYDDEEIASTVGASGRVAGGREPFTRMPNDALLNIDRKVYITVNDALREQLGGLDAIVETSDRAIPQVNPKLSEKQQAIVDHYFANRLNAQVRMLTDESVGLNEARSDNRGTEYTTLMSVMGLDTSMKSVIMSEAKFITMSYLLFNEFNNKELYSKLLELGSHLGPEFNIYMKSVMLKNDFTVDFDVVKDGKSEHKKIEIGPLSRMDYAIVGQLQITSREDKIAYGIDPDADPPVVRTYAEMMFASTIPSERAKAKEPVTRQVIIEQYGAEYYKKILKEAGAIGSDDTVNADVESKFLQKIGGKYWDYYNGIYVYMSMNQSLGESVVNCNPKNGKIMIPQGMGEYIFKMNPETWGLTFEGSYNVHKFAEFMQVIRHMGITSMGAKEGKEVFSFLLSEGKDDGGRVSIKDAIFGESTHLDDKNIDDKKAIAFISDFRSVVIEALYESDVYHLGGSLENDHEKKHELEHLAGHTHMYDGVEIKMKNGKKDFDPTMHRRDLTSTRLKMRSGIEELYRSNPEVFKRMDFTFFKTRFSHDKILMKALNDPGLNEYQKLLIFADRMGDDKMMFEQLSVKRPDDPMKYALEYYDKFTQAVGTLTDSPTFKNAIEALRVVESIVGKGKIGPIAKWLYKQVVELREERMLGEVVVLVNEKDGSLTYDQGNYVGDTPGRKVVPDLKADKITPQDMLDGHGKASKASKMKIPNAVDNEHELRAGREAFKSALMFTDEYYEKLVEEEKSDKKRIRNPHKPLIGDIWNFITGKKLIDYWAVEVFNIPPEMFTELVVGGGIELAEVWLNYFNGGGGGHH